MTTSPNLNLPFVAAGQAQKHVTVNEGLVLIDSLMHLAVQGAPANAPPAEPAQGSRWLVGDTPDGAWTGHAGQLAVFLDGGWRFHAPRAGWLVHRGDSRELLAFDGAAWSSLAQPESLQGLELLGVGMEALAARPLSVAGESTLLTHAGDDYRLTINKAATTDTASVVLQSNWSGRAEMGLAGDDHLRIKVSPDGAAWTEAMRIDKASGGVSMRFFDSQQLVVGANAVGSVTPPSSGGIAFLSLVDASYPQNGVSSIFAYVGSSPLLTTMVLGSQAENRGTTTLTGTTSTDGKVGVAVDGSGHLFIENRFTGGVSRQFCLTFINSWRAL